MDNFSDSYVYGNRVYFEKESKLSLDKFMQVSIPENTTGRVVYSKDGAITIKLDTPVKVEGKSVDIVTILTKDSGLVKKADSLHEDADFFTRAASGENIEDVLDEYLKDNEDEGEDDE